MTTQMLKRRGGRKHRPLLRYHGGKFKIAPWIIQFFPNHECYCEPFGGAASVLLRKPRSAGDIYNDLNGKLVEIFRLLQNPEQAARLVELLKITPYARAEFKMAYEETDDPIESVRRTIVRSFMGFGGDGTTGMYPTGFRATVTKASKTPAQEWANYPYQLATIIDRLRGVTLEQTDAFELMVRIDGKNTLQFVDPPYMPSTRSQGNRRRGKGFHVYEHELTDEDHIRLLDLLVTLQSMVAVSGYDSPEYNEALAGWEKHTRLTHADGGRERTECLWLNPALVAARAAQAGHEANLPQKALI